jgi:glutamate-1-semialdehyde aminotransferase
VDGNVYVDYNLSHGATFLGHNHPQIRKAIQQALDMGVICAYETEYHSRLAETICRVIPCAEHVRFANSGSEATFAAIRLARTLTGKQKLLKFEGHFHGLHDYVVWNAHSPVRDTLPTYPYVPLHVESAGVPPQLADLVIVIPWNDPAAFRQAMREREHEIAAVICEPVNYNSGCILPEPGMLELIREETAKRGIVLIFDEVLSSFRMAPGGAQEYYRVTPDVCTLAKAVANGLPLAVVAGKRDFMKVLSPLGPAAHSGTYSGHLFSILAALASLGEITQPGGPVRDLLRHHEGGQELPGRRPDRRGAGARVHPGLLRAGRLFPQLRKTGAGTPRVLGRPHGGGHRRVAGPRGRRGEGNDKEAMTNRAMTISNPNPRKTLNRHDHPALAPGTRVAKDTMFPSSQQRTRRPFKGPSEISSIFP